MSINFVRLAMGALVGAAFLYRVAAQVPNAQTIHEVGQQYKEGNTLQGRCDNSAIGSQAMFEASLKAKKNIVDMKPNTFLAMWNNPVFAVQFEKYLSAPAETSEDYKVYRQRIDRIMELLKAGNATKANQDEAFNLLTKASEFESDANICTTIHDAVYAAANVRVLVQEPHRCQPTERKGTEGGTIQPAPFRPLAHVALACPGQKRCRCLQQPAEGTPDRHHGSLEGRGFLAEADDPAQPCPDHDGGDPGQVPDAGSDFAALRPANATSMSSS